MFGLLFLLEKNTMEIRTATFAKFVCLKDWTMKTTPWALCEMGPTCNTETVE